MFIKDTIEEVQHYTLNLIKDDWPATLGLTIFLLEGGDLEEQEEDHMFRMFIEKVSWNFLSLLFFFFEEMLLTYVLFVNLNLKFLMRY